MKKLIYALGMMSGLAFSACSKTDITDKIVNKIDLNYLDQASISNTAEVDAGTLAATKATNLEVKKFAQFMVMEHTMAQSVLKDVGVRIGRVIKDTIDPAHVALKMRLLNLPAGRIFDSVYIHSQVTDHDVTIMNFRMEQTNGLNKHVINYANTFWPHIVMHRESADSIANAYFK